MAVLGRGPSVGSPSPAQASLCREVQGKGKILREAGEGGKQALREGAQHGLKAPSQRAFVRPGRAQRCCQPGGAVLAPVAPGDPGAPQPARRLVPATCPWAGCSSLQRGPPSPPAGPGVGTARTHNALPKIIPSDRSISSTWFRLNFIMVSVAMATCKNNESPSPANSP